MILAFQSIRYLLSTIIHVYNTKWLVNRYTFRLIGVSELYNTLFFCKYYYTDVIVVYYTATPVMAEQSEVCEFVHDGAPFSLLHSFILKKYTMKTCIKNYVLTIRNSCNRKITEP